MTYKYWIWNSKQHIFFYCLANFPEQVVDNLPADISTGIYYGWASVGNGDVHKMVVSIGWNPYYKNTKKSMVRIVFHSINEDEMMIWNNTQVELISGDHNSNPDSRILAVYLKGLKVKYLVTIWME